MNRSIIYKAKENKDIQEDLRKLEALQKELKALEQDPCEDAVSRQAVCNIVDAIRDCISVKGYWAILERLKKLPSVNPQKIGHWIKTPQAVMGEGYMWYCDKCEHQVYQDSSRPYPSEKF